MAPSCGQTNQSAIQETRDQLFLDTADGGRLDIVTSNLGLDRPGFGFEDDEWRAIAKLVSLQPKQIRNAFLRMLELCLGPQFARIGTLAANAEIADRQLQALNPVPFIQLGTLIIDPTLPTEETVGYCIRDLVTGQFELKSPLQFAHTIIDPGDGRLQATALAGSVALQLINSSTLPTSGFPYPVIIDRGTLIEEIVQVTANNTFTNTLTLAVGTVFDHSGPITQFVKSQISISFTKTGVGDAIGGAAPNMILTDAAALFAVTDTGKYVTITGSTSPVNDGTFVITAFGGPTNITYTNPVGVVEAFAGEWFISAQQPAGRMFIPLPVDATRKFPSVGWIRVDENGPNDEVVEYEENDVVNNVLLLKTPLQNPHHANEPVELVTPGVLVEVAQIVEEGIHWQLHETSPREVQVTIPNTVRALGPLDATWLHGAVPAPFATTLASITASSDLFLHLTSVAGLPDEAGMLLVNGTQTVFYTLRLASADVTATVATPTLIGATQLSYVLGNFGYTDFPTPVGQYRVVIDPGGGSQEFATVVFTDINNKQLTFSAPLTFAHAAGQTVQLLNQVLLDQEIGNIYPALTAVAMILVPYVGTDLEDGNSRDITGAVILNHFPGGYIFDVNERGVSAISTFLSVNIPPEIFVAFNQTTAKTNIEVDDASLWPSPPFTPFMVHIGGNNGIPEDRTLIDRTLKKDVSGTVQVANLIGATQLDYTLTSVTEFPESDGVFPAGYRIIIDPGGPNEETALVAQNNIGPHLFDLINPLTIVHLIGEQIRILNDVLTTDLLQNAHLGPRINPSVDGESVSPYISELRVSPAPTNFPTTDGFVWLNFGKEILDVRKRIITITSPVSYTLSSTVDLPTSGYPYQIILGDGLFNEEKVFVTNNNPGTGVLTFAAPGAVNAHSLLEYARFISGTPEVTEYRSKAVAPDRLVFITPQLFESRHIVGERVMLSTAISASHEDGSSYGFKLPPDPGGCLTTLFEFVRAAGIKVTITIV